MAASEASDDEGKALDAAVAASLQSDAVHAALADPASPASCPTGPIFATPSHAFAGVSTLSLDLLSLCFSGV